MILDANDLHISIDDKSKALLLGDEEDSKELMNCGKRYVNGIENKALHSTCSSINDETATQEKAADELRTDVEGNEKLSRVPQNTDHGDVQQDEDFVAKDLLCFAWQIARGMVSTEMILLTNRTKTKGYNVKKIQLVIKAIIF